METLQNIISDLLKDKKVLDFKSGQKQSYINNVKKTFSSACKNDDKLSDEYKKDVNNLDNIEVKINYGWNIHLLYKWLDVSYGYDYKSTYQSGQHVTGTAKIDSYGNVEASDLELHKEYSTGNFHYDGSMLLSSNVRKQYEVNLTDKTPLISPSNLMNVKPDADMPGELKKALSTKFTPSKLDELIQSHYPDGIIKDIGSNVNEDNFKNLKVHKIKDFSIDSAELSFFPCSFDVWVEFNGETYGQLDVANISDIESTGETSKHYDDFLKEYDKINESIAFSLIKFLGYLGVAIPLIYLGIIYVLGMLLNITILSDSSGRMTFPLIYVWFGLSLLLSAISYFIVKSTLSEFYNSDYFYSKSLSVTSLKKMMLKAYRKIIRKNFLIAFIIIIVNSGLGYLIWLI